MREPPGAGNTGLTKQPGGALSTAVAEHRLDSFVPGQGVPRDVHRKDCVVFDLADEEPVTIFALFQGGADAAALRDLSLELRP